VRYQTGKSPRNQIIGLHNKEAGEQFEKLIIAACDFYRDNGIAEIDKTPEPMKALYPIDNGKFVACFTKRAQPDFKGCEDGGRCICFEAKHTEQGEISFTLKVYDNGDWLAGNLVEESFTVNP